MDSGIDSTQNIENACKVVAEAAKKGARWIALPEMFTYMGPYEHLAHEARTSTPAALSRLMELAKKLNVVIFAGTVPEHPDHIIQTAHSDWVSIKLSKRATERTDQKANEKTDEQTFETTSKKHEPGDVVSDTPPRSQIQSTSLTGEHKKTAKLQLGVETRDKDENNTKNLDSQKTEKVYNTLCVIDHEGNLVHKYRKTHLFSLSGNDAENRYDEASGYLSGDEFSSILVDGFWVHLSVCFDIRFSGMFQKLQKLSDCDVIICPSAFTQATGSRHWHLLMRARATEYQCYVIASSQVGKKHRGSKNYGHALICDPLGKILCDSGTETGVVYATLDKSFMDQVRSSIPVVRGGRKDLYD